MSIRHEEESEVKAKPLTFDEDNKPVCPYCGTHCYTSYLDRSVREYSYVCDNCGGTEYEAPE